MSFRTQFDAHLPVKCNPGSRFKDIYEAKVDSFGVIDLVKTGSEDLYDYIQSFRDSVDINTIVKRYAAGDVDVLSKKQAVFGDFMDMPKTYAEMLNTVIAGEETFNSLPVEVRAKFNHSFREWLSSMDDMDTWSEKMCFVNSGQSDTSSVQSTPAQTASLDNPVSKEGE